jgi:hypothetical protein
MHLVTMEQVHREMLRSSDRKSNQLMMDACLSVEALTASIFACSDGGKRDCICGAPPPIPAGPLIPIGPIGIPALGPPAGSPPGNALGGTRLAVGVPLGKTGAEAVDTGGAGLGSD